MLVCWHWPKLCFLFAAHEDSNAYPEDSQPYSGAIDHNVIDKTSMASNAVSAHFHF